jgi:hypothetical protein
MNHRHVRSTTLLLSTLLLVSGCTEEVGKKADPGGGGDGGSGGAGPGDTGASLAIEVPETGRVFVRLAKPEIVALDGDGATSTDWDLAFSGYDVFTNSGLSGPGKGGAFPNDIESYDTGDVQQIPFLIEDEAGGAFVSWYAYDPADHVIWSRYHIYGVEKAGRRWKVQLITFYGEVQGAPVTGLFQIRYAEVLAGGPGPTIELKDIDATAGGRDAPETAQSACLDLASGQVTMLTPAAARASSDWHLCFRRAEVSVNGELGGPGGVRAADLQAAELDAETLAEVKERTAASEAAKFEAIGLAELTAPAVSYRGDHIVTAFSDKWVKAGSSPPAPAEIAWLVQAADSDARFVAVFDRFEGATAASPGRVVMRVKPVE